MPNYCMYEMKVNGKMENIDKFISYLKSNYNYNANPPKIDADKHLFRVFEANIVEKEENDGYPYCIINGECAWSVFSCMFSGEHTYYDLVKKDHEKDFKGTTLEECSKELELDIEVFSEEPGVGFMEHYLIKNGDVIIDDCEEYREEYNEETNEYDTIGGIEWDYQI